MAPAQWLSDGVCSHNTEEGRPFGTKCQKRPIFGKDFVEFCRCCLDKEGGGIV